MENFFNPVNVIKSNNWLFDLKNKIIDLNISKPIIVTSSGNFKRLKLENHFNIKSIYRYNGSNPTFNDSEKIIEFCEGKEFNGVIAIGGGSPMDLAKLAMAYLSIGESNIKKLIEYKDNYPLTIPSIFIPTTHGTGSEVTMWGTIWNMTEKKKYSISHPSLYPDIAILDGHLTLKLPIDISIITVLDALSHSFEAIWNKNANDVSTSYAIDAIVIILNNIEKLKSNPSNLDVRNNLLIASSYAGLAFSNTKTAAAHSISYPLTMYYGIPHGVAASISLLPLLDINRNSIEEQLGTLLDFLNMTYDELKGIMLSIPDSIIPFKLNQWGIPRDKIPIIVEKSFTKGRMENNIVNLNFNDVLQIINLTY